MKYYFKGLCLPVCTTPLPYYYFCDGKCYVFVVRTFSYCIECYLQTVLWEKKFLIYYSCNGDRLLWFWIIYTKIWLHVFSSLLSDLRLKKNIVFLVVWLAYPTDQHVGAQYLYNKSMDRCTQEINFTFWELITLKQIKSSALTGTSKFAWLLDSLFYSSLLYMYIISRLVYII